MTAVERVKRELEQTPGVRLAVFFGSSARGTASPRSDLDLGLVLEPDTKLSPAVRAGLERPAGRPVDITWLDTTPPLLRLEIARDGVVLLARSPHAWADFKAWDDRTGRRPLA